MAIIVVVIIIIIIIITTIHHSQYPHYVRFDSKSWSILAELHFIP